MALKRNTPGSAPKTFAPRPGPSRNEEVEQQAADAQQDEPASNRKSRAEMFNNAEPEAGINLPPGSYTAHLVAAQRTEDGQKESVKVDYEVYDGEHAGKTVPTWYNLFDKEGNPQRGMGFLKRDMELMGGPVLDYDEMDNQLQELADGRPLCNITVKKNGQYTNIYFQGLAEGM